MLDQSYIYAPMSALNNAYFLVSTVPNVVATMKGNRKGLCHFLNLPHQLGLFDRGPWAWAVEFLLTHLHTVTQ